MLPFNLVKMVNYYINKMFLYYDIKALNFNLFMCMMLFNLSILLIIRGEVINTEEGFIEEFYFSYN